MATGVKALKTIKAHPSDNRLYYVDFTEQLLSGETLSGTPTVTASPTGLTIASPGLNASSVVIDGKTIAANSAVIVRISGGTDGTTYTLTITCATSLSNTLAGTADFKVTTST